jgi:hypothetical protein
MKRVLYGVEGGLGVGGGGGMPLAGTLEVVVVSVRPVSIHSDSYVDVVCQRAEDIARGTGMRVRIASHLTGHLPGGGIEVGQKLVLEFLMQQVVGVGVAR